MCGVLREFRPVLPLAAGEMPAARLTVYGVPLSIDSSCAGHVGRSAWVADLGGESRYGESVAGRIA
jgi:hypothetical protein